MNLARSTWREIETAIIEYFRTEGGEIRSSDGETYLVIGTEADDDDDHVDVAVSLSCLARILTDPAT